ncbi:MAG: glycerol kinase, partial [Hyphomicrobiales bacterium]|nr:glycerol kinase [Hyphomicrobiales bacterium]
VDGGMTASDWTMQRLADILDRSVERPAIRETTALGAAWLAGSGTGVWPEAEVFAQSRAVERRFEPKMEPATREAKLAGWHDAVERTLSVRR